MTLALRILCSLRPKTPTVLNMVLAYASATQLNIRAISVARTQTTKSNTIGSIKDAKDFDQRVVQALTVEFRRDLRSLDFGQNS